MAYIKQNINFGLFILIVAILIAFIGFTAFYYNTFVGINSNYEQKVKKIDELDSTLTEHKEKLSKTSIELETKAKREQDLSVQYDDLRNVKEQLDVDKANLEAELLDTKSELAQKKAELEVKIERVTTLENTVTIRESTISSLKSDVDTLETEIVTLNNQICTLQGTC
tara:strand:- start:2717 stop:3220 length:504 start_codon:yes stop_codon:yes gene_type:complete